jgi:hypothetical protein
MKTFRLVWISISLMAVLSACNLPGRSSLPTQTPGQNTAGSIATITLQVNPTQTQSITPTNIASAIPTPFPPNAPVWLIYTYTCEFTAGGSTMTMNLNWNDRSNNEEGYKVYRGEQEIATLAPNSTFYVDVAFVAMGKTLSYSVEAFNKDWRASTSTITYGCQ